MCALLQEMCAVLQEKGRITESDSENHQGHCLTFNRAEGFLKKLQRQSHPARLWSMTSYPLEPQHGWGRYRLPQHGALSCGDNSTTPVGMKGKISGQRRLFSSLKNSWSFPCYILELLGTDRPFLFPYFPL